MAFDLSGQIRASQQRIRTSLERLRKLRERENQPLRVSAGTFDELQQSTGGEPINRAEPQNPADRANSPEAQAFLDNQQPTNIESQSFGPDNQPEKAVFTARQAQEAIKLSGAKTAEAKRIFIDKIRNPELRDAFLKVNAIEAREEKKAELDDQIADARAEEDRSRLRKLEDEKAKLREREANQQFGREAIPATPDIVQTEPGSFTDSPGAIGETVIKGTPAQPAIPSEKEKELKTKEILAKIKANTERIKAEERKLGRSKSKSKSKPKTAAQIDDENRKIIEDSIREDLAKTGNKMSDSKIRLAALEKQRELKFRRENAIDKKRGAGFGEDIVQMGRDKDLAINSVNDFDVQLGLLSDPNFDTGALSPIANIVSSYVSAIGFDAKKLGMPDPAQGQIFDRNSFDALLKKLIAQKGVQTEGDAKRALKTFESMGKTKEANIFILNFMKGIALRQIAKDDFYDNEVLKIESVPGRRLDVKDKNVIDARYEKFLKKTPLFIPTSGKDGEVNFTMFFKFKEKAEANGFSEEEIISGWQKRAKKEKDKRVKGL